MRTSQLIVSLSLLAVLPHLASATDLPKRKSGLWETTVNPGEGVPPQTMKECVDEATDTEMMDSANDSKVMGASCSKNEFKRTATGFESESECAMAGAKIHSKVSYTGDFASAYSGSVTRTMTPAMFGDPTSQITMSAKYLGPCAADMKPGDVVLPNGMKMNMKDAAKDAEGMAATLSKNIGIEGGDMAKALAAGQAEMDPEDLKAMQEAMSQLGKMGQ